MSESETKQLPVLAWRTESSENEGYRFGTTLDDLLAWALENGYTPADIRERVEDAITKDSDE